MNENQTDKLNELLRGELAATETYQQAMAKVDGGPGAAELRRLHDEHREAANRLRLHIRSLGTEPEHGSGVWGGFAKAVEGTAKIFGNKAALKALKEGEKSGVHSYQKALHDGLPTECESLIRGTLLPQTQAHIRAIDSLMDIQ